MTRTVSLFAFATAVSAAVLTAQTSTNTLVLRHATVIDGTGAMPRPDVDLVIRDSRIIEIGRRVKVQGTNEIDLTGRFVIPGLIDSHVHVATGPDLQRAKETLSFALQGGVTSVRDMGGDGIVLRDLAAESTRADSQLASLYYSAILAGPTWFEDPRAKASAHGGVAGSLPWLRAVVEPSAVAAAIASAQSSGATGVKLYADIPSSLLSPIVSEAHKQGLRVWTHAALFPATPGDIVESGVDVVSHAALLAFQGVDSMPQRYHDSRTPNPSMYQGEPSASVRQVLGRMREKGIILDATLFVTSLLQRGASASTLEDKRVAWTRAVTQLAHELGVKITAGTDGLGQPGRESLPNIHKELELLVSAGLKPVEAIAAATSVSAEALGIADRVGTVKAGMTADLVILNGDPSTNVSNTRLIEMVVKGGRAITIRPTGTRDQD